MKTELKAGPFDGLKWKVIVQSNTPWSDQIFHPSSFWYVAWQLISALLIAEVQTTKNSTNCESNDALEINLLVVIIQSTYFQNLQTSLNDESQVLMTFKKEGIIWKEKEKVYNND